MSENRRAKDRKNEARMSSKWLMAKKFCQAVVYGWQSMGHLKNDGTENARTRGRTLDSINGQCLILPFKL